jgi:hypothetical protein
MSAQEQWAIFFRYSTDKGRRWKINEILNHEEGIAMASEVLMTISKDQAERMNLISEYKAHVDYYNRMGYERREGIKEGVEKGKEKMKQEMLDLLKSGKSPEEIIRNYTGND